MAVVALALLHVVSRLGVDLSRITTSVVVVVVVVVMVVVVGVVGLPGVLMLLRRVMLVLMFVVVMSGMMRSTAACETPSGAEVRNRRHHGTSQEF